MAPDDFRVLDAARKAALMVNQLIDRSSWKLLYVSRIRDSAGSIPGNIAEGFGRERGADRNYKFLVARGEAKETLSRLRPHFDTGRVSRKDYWEIRDLLTTIVKMLNAMINN